MAPRRLTNKYQTNAPGVAMSLGVRFRLVVSYKFFYFIHRPPLLVQKGYSRIL